MITKVSFNRLKETFYYVSFCRPCGEVSHGDCVSVCSDFHFSQVNHFEMMIKHKTTGKDSTYMQLLCNYCI